jgi:hypothetical protein
VHPDAEDFYHAFAEEVSALTSNVKEEDLPWFEKQVALLLAEFGKRSSGGYQQGSDVPSILSSATIWSPIPPPKEIGREEAVYRVRGNDGKI